MHLIVFQTHDFQVDRLRDYEDDASDHYSFHWRYFTAPVTGCTLQYQSSKEGMVVESLN